MRSVPVLWLCGPSGVGKSTVGHALFEQLRRDGTAVAFVDLDQLRLRSPERAGGRPDEPPAAGRSPSARSGRGSWRRAVDLEQPRPPRWLFAAPFTLVWHDSAVARGHLVTDDRPGRRAAAAGVDDLVGLSEESGVTVDLR